MCTLQNKYRKLKANLHLQFAVGYLECLSLNIGSVPTDLNVYVDEPEKVVWVGRGEYELSARLFTKVQHWAISFWQCTIVTMDIFSLLLHLFRLQILSY